VIILVLPDTGTTRGHYTVSSNHLTSPQSATNIDIIGLFLSDAQYWSNLKLEISLQN